MTIPSVIGARIPLGDLMKPVGKAAEPALKWVGENVFDAIGQKLGWDAVKAVLPQAPVSVPQNVDFGRLANAGGYVPFNPLDHLDKLPGNAQAEAAGSGDAGGDSWWYYVAGAVVIGVVIGAAAYAYSKKEVLPPKQREAAENLARKKEVQIIVQQVVSGLPRQQRAQLDKELKNFLGTMKRRGVPVGSAAFAAMRIAAGPT